MSTIPDNITVNKATLSIFVFETVYQRPNGEKHCYRLTKDWKESTVTWYVPWASPGGDYDGTALDFNSGPSFDVWEDFDVTPAIKDMVESGGDNCGFLIKCNNNTPGRGIEAHSTESDQVDLRPKLTITYDPAVDIIPTPIPKAIFSAGPYNVSIVNLRGREISSCEIDDITQLSRMKSSLSSGIHIVTIQTSGKNSFQMKWMIR